MYQNIKTPHIAKAITAILLLATTESMVAQNLNTVYSNQNITFDTHISTGIQSMVANEYVYYPPLNHTASQLIWDTDSLTMVGIGGSLHFQEKYTFNIEYTFSANKADSKMTDYDWVLPGYDWTHRSIHKNTDVSSASTFDMSAEYTLSNKMISLLVGYREDRATRKAYGGTFVYSDIENGGFRDQIGTAPNSLLGITYKQTWKSPYLGIKADAYFTNLLTLHTKFIYAPVVKGEAFDNHHLRDLTTVDTLDNTHMYAINLGLGYKLSNALTATLDYVYQKYDTTKGDTKWTERGEVRYLKNMSGANLKVSRFSISLSYKF